MRILITTDTVGGVWQYTLALARGLVEQHQCQVALVCLGEPREQDLQEMLPGGSVELFALKLKLEWMPESAEDVMKSLAAVEQLVTDWRPHLIHSNQFCFGLLRTPIPKVVVAHSDVLSWTVWHRGRDLLLADLEGVPPQLRDYSKLVASGLAGASAVVCPSHFMAGLLKRIYGCTATVIHNGLWPDLYCRRPKADIAVLAGRLWDEAKSAAVAIKAVDGLPLRLLLVGPTIGPTGETAPLPEAANVCYLGNRSWSDTRSLLSQARFYLATSSYEPFGLAALEAAFSGCTLIANDIPAYQEIWDGAALFYRRGDPADLREKLSLLLASPATAEALGRVALARAVERFTAQRMATDYLDLYRSLLGKRTLAGFKQSAYHPLARSEV